ncbi:unnamed protein product [Cunninghamella blakesleeana]
MKTIVVMMVAMIALIQAAPVPGSVQGMDPSNTAATAKQLVDQYFGPYKLPNPGMAPPNPNEKAKQQAKQQISGIGRTIKNLPKAPPVPIDGVGPTGLVTGVAGKALGA